MQLQGGHPAASVFHAQQAAEKAAKGLWAHTKGALAPRTHAVGQLLDGLGAPSGLTAQGSRLATRYTAVRYPDLWPPQPLPAVSTEEAAAAIADAEDVLEWVKQELGLS